jgi:hypothetical protein
MGAGIWRCTVATSALPGPQRRQVKVRLGHCGSAGQSVFRGTGPQPPEYDSRRQPEKGICALKRASTAERRCPPSRLAVFLKSGSAESGDGDLLEQVRSGFDR